MQAASVSFRAYALDLWGFGDSSKTKKQYSINDQVDLLDQFLEVMGIGKIAIVGHGLGAVVGLEFTRKYPQFVDRIMCIALPLDGAGINPRMMTSSPADLGSWLLSGVDDQRSTSSEIEKTDPLAILESLNGTVGFSTQEQLRVLSTPSLLVHGENDPAITAPPADGLTDMPQQNHTIVFDKSGHFPMLDNPNKFHRLLTEFLTLKPGESPRQLQLKEEWKRRVR